MQTKELKTLALMVRDEGFLQYMVSNEVDPDIFFPSVIDNYLGSMILELGAKYHRVTDTMLVEEIVRDKDNQPQTIKDSRPQFIKTVKALFSADYTDLDWVRDNISLEIKNRTYDAALRQALEYHENNDTDSIAELFRKVEARVSLTNYTPHTLEGSIESVQQYLQDLKDGKFVGIPTGIPDLDKNFLWGGLGMKELTLILAPPKRGKTMFMVWLAYHAIQQGINVLYISLEVNYIVLMLRIISCHLRTNIQEIKKDPAGYMRMFAKWQQKRNTTKRGFPKRKKRRLGTLTIIDPPTKSITALGVGEILHREVTAGRKPGLTCVDYAKLLRHRSNLSGWEGLGESVEELRGVGAEYDTSMVSGAQGNKASVKKSRLDHDDTGYDFSQMATADTIIGLGKRPDDIPLAQDGTHLPVWMDLNIPPCRNSPPFSTSIETNYAQGRMYVGGGDGGTIINV